jgi:hypothetical protein
LAKAGKLRHDVAMSNAAERSTVSLHEVKVWLAVRDKSGQWRTNDEIAKEAGVKVRTARQYTLRLVKRGLLERAEKFPAYRYRLAKRGVERSAYQQKI